MLVVEVLVAVGVLFAVSALATRRVPGMVGARPDRPPFELPESRPLGSEDIDGVRFAVVFRGYRMDEVDSLLDRLGRELAERDARIAELSAGRVPDEPAAEDAPPVGTPEPDDPHDADTAGADSADGGFRWWERPEGTAWPSSS